MMKGKPLILSIDDCIKFTRKGDHNKDIETIDLEEILNVFNTSDSFMSFYTKFIESIQTKKLENYTSLNWKVPKNGKTKGYYILMRETTSAVWQKKFYTTETEYKLPYSKDNYFFAVQSVSETGNESLPVIPGVAR